MLCDVFFMICFFFFKQKTAYEMRISDWSSDVCSSDLSLRRARQWSLDNPTRRKTTSGMRKFLGGWLGRDNDDPRTPRIGATAAHRTAARLQTPDPSAKTRRARIVVRSEEHTSELQSLMRISSAVFCLQKTNITQHKIHKLSSS